MSTNASVIVAVDADNNEIAEPFLAKKMSKKPFTVHYYKDQKSLQCKHHNSKSFKPKSHQS